MPRDAVLCRSVPVSASPAGERSDRTLVDMNQPSSVDVEIEDRYLLSVEAAAQALAVSARTVRNEIVAGRLETVRLGRRRLVPVQAIAAYVDRLRAEAAS